jgi:hypothetical protein
MKALLRAYLGAITALNAGKTFDTPGSFTLIHRNCSGRAASLTHAAEDTVININRYLSSGSFILILCFDRILYGIRTMKYIFDKSFCHTKIRHDVLHSVA